MTVIRTVVRTSLGVAEWGTERLLHAIRHARGEDGDAAPFAPPPVAAPTPAPSPAPPKDIGDADLTNKVSSIVLRGMRGEDKGRININVVDGVVFLRGEARTPARINGLEEKARAIPEVRDVQNLLHLPHTPAPTRADTPREQQRTRRHRTPPEAPRREPRRLNADKTTARGEPTPDELAAEHAGRPASPFGSHDPGEGS